jgi:hypothetical protein
MLEGGGGGDPLWLCIDIVSACCSVKQIDSQFSQKRVSSTQDCWFLISIELKGDNIRVRVVLVAYLSGKKASRADKEALADNAMRNADLYETASKTSLLFTLKFYPLRSQQGPQFVDISAVDH